MKANSKASRLFFLFFLLMPGILPVSLIYAQDTRFSASGPSQAAVGERFRVTYTLNARGGDFTAPDFGGLRVIQGPSQSSSSSTQIINGQVSTSVSLSFSYILEAAAEGSFTISPARIRVDGREYQSEALSIRISGQAQRQTQPQPQAPGQQDAVPQPAGEKDLFVRAHVSNFQPFQSEQVIITYKLYTRVPVSRYSIEKLPAFQGFWSENLALGQTQGSSTETIDGVTYNVAEIRRVALFPQRSGELIIEPLEVEALVRVRSQRRGSIFDDFFGGSPFDSFQNVQQTLRSNPVRLQVKALPAQNRPASFNGLSGQFELTAGLQPENIAINDATTLKITLKGSGNLRMAGKPDIQFPHNLEAFDPNVSETIRRDPSGVSGQIVYEYLLIPRTGGEFEIPAFQFSWFDPRTASYKTSQAGPFKLMVDGSLQAAGTVPASPETAALLQTDIRHIHTRPVVLAPAGSQFYGSRMFYFWLLLPIVLCALVMVILRREIRLRADAALMKNRKAEKTAKKRLRKASVYLGSGEAYAFYDEVFHALWGYIADKLSIPVSRLTKEEVSGQLRSKGVSDELSEAFIAALNECEFARFAPSSEQARMQELYDKTLELIIAMEKAFRSGFRLRPGRSAMAGAMLMVASLSAVASSPAELFQKANEAYNQGEFAHAIEMYEEILSMGYEAPELFYNLGNACFRENKIARAILNYERGLLRKPGDENLLFNLQIARTRTIDRIEPLPVIFYERWLQQIIARFSADQWAVMAILGIVVSLMLIVWYFFGKTRQSKIIAFVFFLIAGSVSAGMLFAAQKRFVFESVKPRAVVMQPRATAKSAPGASSPDLFVVHEGTTLRVTDQLGEWAEVRLENGNLGWIRLESIEFIR